MKKKQEKYRRLRAFCAAFTLTFCLLLMGVGFLIADYNTRQVGFGSGSLRLDISTREGQVLLNLFGREQAVTISDEVQKWAGRLWLLQSERAAAPALLDWAGVGQEDGSTGG